MIEIAVVCLAMNVYFEARDQPVAGQVAVAQVVMNRVADPRWPNDVCGVVYQNKYGTQLHKCQFSWYCDGKHDSPTEWRAWYQAQLIATAVIDGSGHGYLKGVTHYHAVYSAPYWRHSMKKVVRIGDHVFYAG